MFLTCDLTAHEAENNRWSYLINVLASPFHLRRAGRIDLSMLAGGSCSGFILKLSNGLQLNALFSVVIRGVALVDYGLRTGFELTYPKSVVRAATAGIRRRITRVAVTVSFMRHKIDMIMDGVGHHLRIAKTERNVKKA